jgi:phosphatidylserine/phosphatidylglycerophosphate/cardiolipin synthase-like enzyme
VAVTAAVTLAPPATGVPDPADGPSIVRVVPNPVADEDRGESVTLSVPPGTRLGAYTLDDGEDRVALPNRTVGGRVTLTGAPGAVANRSTAGPATARASGSLVRVPGFPALANGGERLQLRHDGVLIDGLTYRDAPEGEAYRPPSVAGEGGFRPIGATAFPVRRSSGGHVRAFVLPDAPGPPVATLRGAEDRLLLAGYTLTSERVTDALVAATERGVAVRVLVEGGPVGGLSRAELRRLDRLVDAGVSVRLVGGPAARYDYQHAKFAVADDRAVVLTENWKPAGVGGNGSRGWGVVVTDAGTADALARTFRSDFRARDARAWRAVRATHADVDGGGQANGSYPTRFEPRRFDVRETRVLVAPDNAERAVVSTVDGADRSVRVLQMTVGGPRQPFVRALVRAARRGVRVRMLLSSAWYAREENRAVARALNDRAAREGLDLDVRLADPRGRYGKVHAKGVVVDRETVLVGSLNWNNHSARENREVVLAVRSDGAADYFARVFRADWRGGAWRLPFGVLLVVALGTGGAVALAHRFEFEPGQAEDHAEQGERVGW